MAIAFVARSDQGGASGGDLTVSKPTGTLDNHILVANCYSEGGATAFTLPAGWAWVAAAVQNTNSNFWHRLAWKRASSEPTSWTFTHSPSAWRTVVVSAWSGCVTSGDPQDSTAVSTNGNTTTVTAGSITNATANSMNIAFVMSYNLDDLGVSGSGYTDNGVYDVANMFYGVQASSGASGVKTFTSASAAGNWASWHISLKEASVAVTLEQEGFRFFNDDGSESTATGAALQDTNLSLGALVNTRLRMLLNATGDPPSRQFRLEYRKNNTGHWRLVK